MIPEIIIGIIVVILLCGIGMSLIRSINKGKSMSYSPDPYQLVISVCPWKDKKGGPFGL